MGTAIGYGMCGGRVIAEIMYCDFLGRSGMRSSTSCPNGKV
ncbi:MAG: hypothetical protein U0T82_10025 [Bacteroidales bacterium]